MTASQAGGTLHCRCDREVPVPRLSELRLAAGQTAHRLSVAESIGGMIKSGELPGTLLCASCGRDSDQVAWLNIQCEKASTSESDNTFGLALAFLGWIGALVEILSPKREYQPPEIHGRELCVTAPIACCSNCLAPAATKVRRREARELLVAVPIYSDLLKEYPRAGITLDHIDRADTST